jgi:hypothetical protein
MPEVTTISGAAARFGKATRTIVKALATLGIKTKPIEHSPAGKGITPADMARLKTFFEGKQK